MVESKTLLISDSEMDITVVVYRSLVTIDLPPGTIDN
jgi:hypothetical protein